MRRTLLFIIAAIATAALSAAPAFATAKFLSATAIATDGNLRTTAGTIPTIHGGLYVSFKEVGLGNPNTDYEVTADAEVIYVCLGNGPDLKSRIRSRSTVTSAVHVSATFSTDKNGNVVGAIAVAPPPPDKECYEGQVLDIASSTYTNVVITDLVRDISKPIPGTFTKVFISE